MTMTTELTKAAQQALERLKLHQGSAYCNACEAEDDEVIAALERALSQRPAAQAGDLAGLIRGLKVIASTTLHATIEGSSRAHDRDLVLMACEILSTLPAPQQATPEPGEWHLVNPAGEVVAVEKTAVKALARINGYKPSVEGLLGYEELGWRIQPAMPEPVGEHVAVVDGGCLMFVCDAPLPDGAKLYTHAAQPVPVTDAWDWLTEANIDAYLEDYEMRGEDEAGRDGSYTPTEGDRALIKDFVFGLLAEAQEAAHHGITAQAKKGGA